MGRHRRSGAAPAAEDYAAGTDRRHRGARRKRGAVRTGLLGVSAAVAVGAVAVTSGLLPGGDTLTVGSVGTDKEQSQSRQAPELTTQGGSSATPTGPSSTSASPSAPKAPTAPRSSPVTKSPSATPSTAKPKPKPKPTRATTPPKPTKPVAPPSKTATPKPVPTTTKPVPRAEAPAAPTQDRAAAAEAEVVRLVNAERAKVGCSAVRSDAALAKLAGAFSQDMAARGFFDHTDPDGDTPWERARQAGVTGMGGENIARGQADAAAVMESWMNSDGHRANILNCDYTTLGVGVHFADGGPWWTQDFGF
ncbi:CAP domain-containing protein [Streptomyces sp. NPDC090127]|uniref:CAP domain-containing protein n=1 Tax=Streptomyces sp. NPDC090127 TaxID=3365953 RepID=UPI0037F6DE69